MKPTGLFPICRARFFRAATCFFLTTAALQAQTATPAWTIRYNGFGGDDQASAVAVDGAGNVIVTGFSANASGDNDFYTAKYAAASGTLLWERRYDSPTNTTDLATALALDPAGHVAVTGVSYNLDGTTDYYTAKYAAATGALLWERRYNSAGNYNDLARSVAADAAGNVIVTGYSYNAATTTDFYTVKYAAADGAVIWEKYFNGPDNGFDQASAVAIDAAGNVVVTGLSTNATLTSDYYTVKYAAATGAVLWEKRFNGPDNDFDQAGSVAIDAAGNVLVTGHSSKTGLDPDFYTIKYAAADGAVLWEKRYDSPGNGFDTVARVAVDSGGNAIVTGESTNPDLTADIATLKYAAADGTLLWTQRYDGPVQGDDVPTGLTVDAAGNVVIGGISANAGDTDYYVAKYAAADGAILWEARYDGPDNGNDHADALAVTPDGGAIIAGFSYNAANPDATTIYYAPPAGDADADGLPDWWELMWWGTTTIPTALGDLDRDGKNELLELGFGLNPTRADRTPLPPVMLEGGYLTITIPKRYGAIYEVQSAGTASGPAFSAATTTMLVDDATTLKVRDNFLLGTAPGRYLRVKVTEAP